MLAPSGAHIHGRLTYFGQSYQFELALEFELIEINGTAVSFHVALASDLKSGIRLHAQKRSHCHREAHCSASRPTTSNSRTWSPAVEQPSRQRNRTEAIDK